MNLLHFSPAPLTCGDAKRQWIAAFCPALSPSLQSNDYKPVLWCVCSNQKVPCLAGKPARNAFDAIQKERLLAFYEFDDNEENALLLDTKTLSSSDLDDESDIYVLDPDFNWCYINTHEDGFGPYFIKKKP